MPLNGKNSKLDFDAKYNQMNIFYVTFGYIKEE